MKGLKFWAGLVTLLISGVLIGASGTWIVIEKRYQDRFSGHGPGIERFLVQKLTRELSLDETQREGVEKILCQTSHDLQELRQSIRPQRQEIFDRSIASIKTLLNPEQQQRFDELQKRMEDRRNRRERSQENPGGRRSCEEGSVSHR